LKRGGASVKYISMENRAAIDAGTNSIRLLIARDGDVLNPVWKDRRTARLGADLVNEGLIGASSFHAGIRVFREYKARVDALDVSKTRAGGTAVFRRARNARVFIDEVFRCTGIRIEVLSEEEEARLSVSGVLSVIRVSTDAVLVFDVGGGSTEFIFCIGREPRVLTSLELGAVSLTSRFMGGSDPPHPKQVAALYDCIQSELKRGTAALRDSIRRHDPQGITLVGTAGTVATLASMLQELPSYDPERVNNFIMDVGSLEQLCRKLASLPIGDRAQLAGLEPGRADIIMAGALIVLAVLRSWKQETLVCADAGLLEGLLLSMP